MTSWGTGSRSRRNRGAPIETNSAGTDTTPRWRSSIPFWTISTPGNLSISMASFYHLIVDTAGLFRPFLHPALKVALPLCSPDGGLETTATTHLCLRARAGSGSEEATTRQRRVPGSPTHPFWRKSQTGADHGVFSGHRLLLSTSGWSFGKSGLYPGAGRSDLRKDHGQPGLLHQKRGRPGVVVGWGVQILIRTARPSTNSAPLKSAPARLAPRNLQRIIRVFPSWAPERSDPERSAPLSSSSVRSSPASLSWLKSKGL